MTESVLVHPWAPVADEESEILILGTMPSPASLADGWYYGHPRNAFWDIMGDLIGAHRHLSPDDRARKLRSHKFALWDVLKSCVRPGALDVDIRNAEPNDFRAFLEDHKRIDTILFNGATAEALWQGLVAPTLGRLTVRTLDGELIDRHLVTLRLPSTSPAHARPPAEKLDAWRRGLDRVRPHGWGAFADAKVGVVQKSNRRE